MEACPIRTVVGWTGEPTEKCKTASSSADGTQPFAELSFDIAPRTCAVDLNIFSRVCLGTSGYIHFTLPVYTKTNGVLTGDAQTAKTLFGGPARASKERAAAVPSLWPSSTRWLVTNARMKFGIPCMRKSATVEPNMGAPGPLGRGRGTQGGGFAFSGRCNKSINCN
jgi:hypothetical protein